MKTINCIWRGHRPIFWVAFALLITFAGGAAARAEGGAATVGKLETFRLPTQLVRPFKGHDMVREVLVYTPAAYDDPANTSKRFPVVYLLHGSPGNPSNFLKLGQWPQKMEQAVKSGQIPPAIFVIPDGNYAGQKEGDSEWADSADRRDRFETWIVKEVVPWADAHYRTRADLAGRFLAGVSEGGFGSVNLALRNPKVFGGAIGLSGYYDMRGFGWGHIIMNDSEAAMSLNSPLYYVPLKTAGRMPPEWKNMRFFIGAGADEKPYADHTRRMGSALQSAGIKAVTVKTPKGKHDWGLWSSLFMDGLRAVLPSS